MELSKHPLTNNCLPSYNGLKKGVIIGQAPPEKAYDTPFGRTRLYKWFSEIGLPKTNVISLFEFDALINHFPGKNNSKHNIPSAEEISAYIPAIIQKIQIGNINLIVPVGKLAAKYVLNKELNSLSEVVGQAFYTIPFGIGSQYRIVIPLPHPSGLSTWVFEDDNYKLLKRALILIKDSLTTPSITNDK